MVIAVQPDDYGPYGASSPRWIRLLEEAGHDVRLVDVYRADILEQLKGCVAFMWRFGHVPQMLQIARRLLPVLENKLGMLVYPDQNTCWHYDDKISQAFLLSAAAVPIPKTWVWHARGQALTWARSTTYPVVLKLSAGAGSSNVCLIRSFKEAETWINRLFTSGVTSLSDEAFSPKRRLFSAVDTLLRGGRADLWELHKGYGLFQEFLHGNAYDTRITVIGNRAFGFRRFNRDGDFRASGSGKIDYDPQGVDPAFVKLAFETARKLGTQSCAIDGLWRGQEAVVGEISYTYVTSAVYQCPGHWDPDLKWHKGQMWPEDAQVKDFLERICSIQLSGRYVEKDS
jgi:hypothetical protein